MREQARILVVGSANMDLVAYCDRLPRPGETLLGGDFATFPGGKGANQAVAVARAGGKVAFLGRVGADDFGIRLRAGLAADGVDTRWLESVEGPSGVAVILAGGGDNMIVVAPGANSTLDSTALAAEAFAGARLVLCQLEIPLDGVSAAARCAHEAGAGVLPLLASFLRAVDLAAALRAGDFFCAADLAAARAAGFFAFLLAIRALPFVSLGRC